MSFLIKGMETPTRCWDCLLNTYGYCMASEHSDIIPADAPIPKWRPLIPVPEHGRLIDADALLNEKGVGTLIAGWGKMYHSTTIEYAPTIIPADKEGEA